MENILDYTILPCGLKQSSVKEIVDAYNHLTGETRQYRDLIFVNNFTIITNDLILNKDEFGVLKVLINQSLVKQSILFTHFHNPVGSQNYNNGCSLFNKLKSFDEHNFYADFSVFTFK